MNQRAIEAGARAIAKMRQDPCAEAYLPEAASVITAYEAYLKAEGLVVVPVTPSQAMYAAWMCDHRNWSERYAAMVAAAQEPNDASD